MGQTFLWQRSRVCSRCAPHHLGLAVGAKHRCACIILDAPHCKRQPRAFVEQCDQLRVDGVDAFPQHFQPPVETLRHAAARTIA